MAICNWNGEHGWSLFRTGRGFDVSNRERRSPAFAERKAESDGRPQKGATNKRLSDVGIPCDQNSCRQELAVIPEEIFEHEIMNRRALKRIPPPSTALLETGRL
jgi:hypothetical protein